MTTRRRTNICFTENTDQQLKHIRESVQNRYGNPANSLHTRAAIYFLSMQTPETIREAMHGYLTSEDA